MRAILVSKFLLLIGVTAIFYQCNDPHERFDDPPWLGGDNIETLEKSGNYTHFLELMDKAEYRVSIENQMFTLFVPNDSSFEAYFDKAGIASVNEMTTEAAEELFGQHILVNPRSREQLLYEYAWEELQDDQGEYGTLFNRKQTYSVPLDYSELVLYNELYKDQTVKIYRENTFVPLFTSEYFKDYFGDPQGSDYLFMYPDSYWSGTQWHDAMVTEGEVRTASGFIYYIDRVVAPIPTIDKYMKDNQDKFGIFYDIAQRFATYANPRVNEQNERRYRKGYTQILNIADERGPNTDNPANMLYMFSAFVPYDNVMQDFLDNTVYKYYTSIDSVPQLFLVYLLQSHLNKFLNLPSKMEKRFINYFGDDIKIDINNDIETSIMCSNGIIYGMNRLIEPNAFTCVPGPVFYNKNYTTFLYALNQSGQLNSLTQADIDVTLLATKNNELNTYGIRENKIGTETIIQVQSSDGLWHDMDDIDLQDFVKDYFCVGNIENFDGEGFIRMASDNFIYYNNGKIYGGGNQVDGDFCTIAEQITSEKNGNLYYLDHAIKAPLNAAELLLTDPDLSAFANLIYSAGLMDSVQADYEIPGIKYPRVIFMSELKQWTLLAPSNQAIAQAEQNGLIPVEQEALRDFIYYHFARNKVVFDDGLFSGIVPSHCIDTIIGAEVFYKNLNFTNGVHNLQVDNGAGLVVPITHSDANHLIENGVIHKINTVLIAAPN